MDLHRNIILTSLSKFLASQTMKKMVTRLLVSVSIFSLVFSYSSSYPQNLNYFSSNSFQVMLSKKCIFFICNGLLVFLAKTSGFVLSSPNSDFYPNEMLQKRIGDGLQIALDTKSESPLEKDHVTLMEESHKISKDQEEEEEDYCQDEEECLNESAEDEISIFIAESDEELGVENDENGSKNCWLFLDEDQLYGQEDEQEVYWKQEEEDEEEEEDDDDDDDDDGKEEKLEMLSTEELNKKFEDFIRKMKEEIRINEVRQQLLMVN